MQAATFLSAGRWARVREFWPPRWRKLDHHGKEGIVGLHCVKRKARPSPARTRTGRRPGCLKPSKFPGQCELKAKQTCSEEGQEAAPLRNFHEAPGWKLLPVLAAELANVHSAKLDHVALNLRTNSPREAGAL